MFDFDKEIAKYHEELRQEFSKLLSEAPHSPQCGDRVIVAAGLLGMGHVWIREEAVVEECAGTSYLVRFPSRDKFAESYPGANREWIHQSLITDVCERS